MDAIPMRKYAGCNLTTQNELLRSLSATKQNLLFPHLEQISLSIGSSVSEPGDAVSYVYFPIDCIISLLYETESGQTAEIAVVGNDGMVGTHFLLGGRHTHCRAIVRSAGTAYRMSAQRLKEEFDRHDELLRVMLRYIQALITHMAQTAACNRHHSVEQQLCRYLLLSLDRLHSPTITITHELIANMLGVRREGVTQAAGILQRLGIIECRRGRITVLNRPQLEKLSCECYAIVKNEVERLRAC